MFMSIYRVRDTLILLESEGKVMYTLMIVLYLLCNSYLLFDFCN